jgi:hypothetical protein
LRKHIFILIIFFISNNNPLAQEVKNYIGGGFGGSDFHIKDLSASPLIFKSTGIAPAFEYFYKGEIDFHYVKFLSE